MTVLIAREVAIERLKKAFPNISGIKPQEEWSGENNETAIFLGDAGEGGEIDGIPACDYHTTDYKEVLYVAGGVHKKLDALLSGMGYFAEWYDAGTISAYPI